MDEAQLQTTLDELRGQILALQAAIAVVAKGVDGAPDMIRQASSSANVILQAPQMQQLSETTKKSFRQALSEIAAMR